MNIYLALKFAHIFPGDPVCKNVERLRWGQESRSGADEVRACALQPLSQDCLGGGRIRLLHHIAATLVINGL